MRAANVLVVLMLALVVAQAWVYLPHVSGPLPSHFGPAGRPDGWTDRGGMIAITAGLVMLATFIGYALPSILGRLPGGCLNLPRRDEWLSTPAGADRARELIGTMLRVVAAATLALFVAIQQWVYTSALRGAPRVPPLAVLALVVVYLAVVLAAQIAMARRFRRGPSGDSGGSATSGARVYSAGRAGRR